MCLTRIRLVSSRSSARSLDTAASRPSAALRAELERLDGRNVHARSKNTNRQGPTAGRAGSEAVGSDFSSKSGRVPPKRVTLCPRSHHHAAFDSQSAVSLHNREAPARAGRGEIGDGLARHLPRPGLQAGAPARASIATAIATTSSTASKANTATSQGRLSRIRAPAPRAAPISLIRSLPPERHALPPPAAQSPGQIRREAIAIVIARQAADGNLAAFRRNPTMRTVSARPATRCCPNVPAVGRRSADFARMSADTRQTGAGPGILSQVRRVVPRPSWPGSCASKRCG